MTPQPLFPRGYSLYIKRAITFHAAQLRTAERARQAEFWRSQFRAAGLPVR
jgi:hypothetical protein